MRFLFFHYDAVEGQSFSQIDVLLIAFREFLAICGWGRLPFQGAGQRAQCYISHFLSAAVSCVETARPSSLHFSIIWFSYKLGSLIWESGACTLRAQRTSTSAVWRLRSLTGE
jgi:hypothetical protein